MPLTLLVLVEPKAATEESKPAATDATTSAELEAEIARRKARAARFGVEYVEPKPAPQPKAPAAKAPAVKAPAAKNTTKPQARQPADVRSSSVFLSLVVTHLMVFPGPRSFEKAC